MKWYRKHMVIYSILLVVLVLVLVAVLNFVIIMKNGSPVPVPTIPRDKTTIGSGTPLTYVIMGDSTSVGQGGDYAQGIAVETADHIAKAGHTVTYQNFGVSGATVNDVLTKQLDQATSLKPDMVLIAIGANDVTHLTNLKSIESDTILIIDKLRNANPNCKIVITGSPQVGSVPRFPQPAKYLAKARTAQINKVFNKVVSDKDITFARIADRTGQYFTEHPELFAVDKFHPTNEGYAVWFPVLNEAIDSTL